MSDKKEKIPVSGPVRKAYIMLDESYEAMQPGSGPRRQGSWREKEVARRKNHNLGLAHHLGRRRQSWMSGGQQLGALLACRVDGSHTFRFRDPRSFCVFWLHKEQQ